MAKNIELLLHENVDNLGIVGDVVKVRTGYARNFLLPRGLADVPTKDAIAALADKRAKAEKELAELRKQREGTVSRLEGYELTLERACNDQGVLYASVTQQDIASALAADGYDVRAREVRLPHAIKRVDSYDLSVKFESDLEAHIKLWVVADRALESDERDEMEFDDEGNLVEPSRRRKPARAPAEEAEAPAENA